MVVADALAHNRYQGIGNYHDDEKKNKKLSWWCRPVDAYQGVSQRDMI